MISRRDLALGFAAIVAGCSKEAARCGTCGMKIDSASPFRSQIGEGSAAVDYDTVRCALTAWKARGGSLRVQEFYSRAWLDGSATRFVKGSDVLGPMGPDLIAVDPTRVEKFQHDHGGTHVYALTEIDDGALAP